MSDDNHYKWLLNSSPVLLAWLDAQGRYQDASDAYLNRLGFSRDELIDSTAEAHSLPATKQRMIEEYLPKLQRVGRLRNLAIQQLSKDGEVVEFLASAIAKRDSQGNILRAVFLYTEVAAHTRADGYYYDLYRRTPAMLHTLDGQGRIETVNDCWLDQLGYRRQEVVGRPLGDFLTDASRRQVVSSGRLTQALQTGVLEEQPREFLTRDGQVVEVLASAIAERNPQGKVLRMHTALHDVTDRNRAERALAQLQRRYQLILQAVGEGIYGLDAEGRATFANPAATRMLGWPPEEIIGKPLHALLHHSKSDGSPYPTDQCPIYASFRDGKIHRIDDEVFWRKDGTSFPVEYISTPIREADKLIGAVVVFRDITERIHAEYQRQAAFAKVTQLKEELELERDYLREEVKVAFNFGEILGESPALKRVLAQIEAVAGTPASVLVLGESGVGKELVARAIHAGSSRAEAPLVKVNCASIPRELFDSEFFGHVKGAFTGAHRDRIGRFELAHRGTLFLDEVTEVPLELQGKLLRVLQEKELERVGDETTRKVDVRIIAATNRDLKAEVDAGRFREDLYYRLSVFPLEVPPLRERREDIIPLATHFLRLACRHFGRHRLAFTQQQAQALQAYDWPGNIRELQNVIDRAVILANENGIALESALPAPDSASMRGGSDLASFTLDPAGLQPSAKPEPESSACFVTDADFRHLEKQNMITALDHAQWRIAGHGGAAELLGLKPSTLASRMKVLGIRKPT